MQIAEDPQANRAAMSGLFFFTGYSARIDDDLPAGAAFYGQVCQQPCSRRNETNTHLLWGPLLTLKRQIQAIRRTCRYNSPKQ